MNNFEEVFVRLKRILQDIPGALVTTDSPVGYSLNTPYAERYKKEVFLAAVQIKKNYVSFHLMPVYAFPELLAGISPGLKKHMQGKSCFNFKQVDEDLFTELAALAARGIERFYRGGLL